MRDFFKLTYPMLEKIKVFSVDIDKIGERVPKKYLRGKRSRVEGPSK